MKLDVRIEICENKTKISATYRLFLFINVDGAW